MVSLSGVPGVLHLVDGELPFINQRLPQPIMARILGAPARHGQLTVAVVEFDVDGVGIKPAIVGDGHATEAGRMVADTSLPSIISWIAGALVGASDAELPQLAGQGAADSRERVIYQAAAGPRFCCHGADDVADAQPTGDATDRAPSSLLPRLDSSSSTRLRFMVEFNLAGGAIRPNSERVTLVRSMTK